MAGSPRYIELLERAAAIAAAFTSDNAELAWESFDHRWKRLEERQNLANLNSLALAGFDVLAHLTNTPIQRLAEEARALHIAKNAGYAGADNPDPWANFRMATAFGVNAFTGTLVRLSDKYIRTVNLRRDPSNERVGEALSDTVRDAIAYALIAYVLKEEELEAAA